MTGMGRPDWWHPMIPSEEQRKIRPKARHHYVGHWACENKLWRYFDAMSPAHQSILFDPEKVRCERRVEFGSGTEFNAYWCHRWTFYRCSDSSRLADVFVTTFFHCANSTHWVDDGMDGAIHSDDVKAMAGMWERALER